MSISLQLPVELASLVASSCESEALIALCLTNKAWQCLAQRSLFRKVQLRSFKDCVTCCRTLFQRLDLCTSIREFLLISESEDSLFPAFWNMLARALSFMANLAALHFALSGPSNVVFRDCTFPRLRVLSSVLDISPELTGFLVRHPSIREICIGGDTPADRDLILPASALPALESYLGSRTLAMHIIPGRPVAQITLAWTTPMSDGGIAEVFRTLARSSVPVRRFSCTTFGADANGGIVHALAAHMPDLHTLRISNVAGAQPLDAAFVASVNTSLQKFRGLQLLDFPCILNATGDEGYDYAQEAREERVVRVWAAACPSLEVVTLPSCMTWRFERDRSIWRREMEEEVFEILCSL